MARSAVNKTISGKKIKPHVVFETLAGSRLYGTNRPDSDWDYRGIIIPPREYFLGLSRFDQLEWHDRAYNEDCVYYDIRKFISLCLQGNPNVLELLWTTDKQTSWGEWIRSLREYFITQKAISAHIGMAKAHLKKMAAKGLNCKDALHVTRVIDQCYILVTQKTMIFNNPLYMQNYQDILAGKFSLETIEANMNATIDLIRSEESHVPKDPDFQTINQHVVNLVEDFLLAAYY